MNLPLNYRIGQRLLTIDYVWPGFEQPLLRDVSRAIDHIVRARMHQGQVVCILGPSGIGKPSCYAALPDCRCPKPEYRREYFTLCEKLPRRFGKL